jgi:hypothetical protein
MTDINQPAKFQITKISPTIITPINSFGEFMFKHPWLSRKLLAWASPYRSNQNGTDFKTDLQMVESYIFDFVLSKPVDKTELQIKLDDWTPRLSDRERKTIAQFLKISPDLLDVPNTDRDWYDSVNVDYLVLHEPIVHTHRFNNDLIGVTTRNSYGADILNTDRMLIVDVDLRSNSQQTVIIQSESFALRTLKYIAETTNTFWRVYRTAGGLRYLEVSRPFDPNSDETRKIMQSLYVDPLYLTLCRRQSTFRARLTPKPWRSQLTLSDDNSSYFDRSMDYIYPEAVCTRITTKSGKQKPIPEFRELVEYHDRVTKSVLTDRTNKNHYTLT